MANPSLVTVKSAKFVLGLNIAQSALLFVYTLIIGGHTWAEKSGADWSEQLGAMSAVAVILAITGGWLWLCIHAYSQVNKLRTQALGPGPR